MAVGPLRVSAGVIRLRPVRMRDGVHWSRIRLADRAHLEPWEPSADGEWTVRHTVAAWPAVCSGLRSEARNGRMLPYVIELDGQFCGQLTIGNVTHGALRSAWIGYWVPRRPLAEGWPPERWRWVSTTASVRSCCIESRPPCARRMRPVAPCWQRLASARRGCCAVTLRLTGHGETIC